MLNAEGPFRESDLVFPAFATRLALLSVHERLVLGEMEHIAAGEVVEIGAFDVRRYAFRRVHGRLEQPSITEVGTSSISLDLIRLNRDGAVNGEGKDPFAGLFAHLASFFSERV